MDSFNYNSSAELYPSRRFAKSQQTQYRRFSRAAEAVRYIVEDMPGTWLTGSVLEVDEKRYEGAAIRALYDAPGFPLQRQPIAA